MDEQEKDKLRMEGREHVVRRMLSKGTSLTLEEIADLCDLEMWRVREIKENYRRNRVHIDYEFRRKEISKKVRDRVNCELIFEVMKRREQGIYEESDEYIMDILKINDKELSEYKTQYLVEKNKKYTAKEKMEKMVEKNKREKGMKYIIVKGKVDEGMPLDEALELHGLTKEEFEKLDFRIPRPGSKKDNE